VADVTPAAKLSAHGIIVRRGGRTIVDVPALHVAPGEVLAIIGPNGAGKSTLILQLALLERPDAGVVRFDGALARRGDLRLRRRMAVMFQEPLLLDRTARANVETGMRLRGVGRRERHERATRWLARFGIEQMADRSPRTLSGGEAQRVSLARAFALEPDVLLMDEPFSALDAASRAAIADDLAGVLADTRTTALLVTHDRDEAARFGDRVAVMMDGRIRATGTPAEVFGSPADEDVAAFVGVETIVSATVDSRAGDLVTLNAGGHLVEALAPGTFERALVCLRPEDISIGPSGEHATDSARNRIPGRVRRIVRSGADARVEVDCGFTLTARVTRRSADELGLEDGVAVVATFKATAVHVIPK
jgi:tungstate transport system ATP-binding protein